MRLLNWRNKREQPTSEPLVVPNRDGTAALTLPGEVVDSIRYIYTRVGQKDRIPPCLSVIAALRGEGVTTISQALAATMAHDLRARVCLIDLNWWWPSNSPLTDPENPGLAAVFAGDAHLADVIVRTGWRNLYCLPAGTMPRDDRPVVAHSRYLKGMLDELNQQFDYLILDIPAILATSDAVSLASLGSACCLVIRQGVTRVEDVRLALDEASQLTMLGVVLNQFTLKTPKQILRFMPAR